MEPEFEVVGLSKSYQGLTAIRDLSLTIEAGSLVFLLGANGSGKSSFLKCLMGHQYWDSGEIRRFGKDRKRDREQFNSGMHLISEDVIPPLATIRDLKSLYANIYGNWDEAVFSKLIGLSGIEISKTLQSCSRGQRIQGILALTLASLPETLLIDEATAVLDPYIRNRFIHEILEMRTNRKMTTIIATNIATEISGHRGRLVVLENGGVALDMMSDRIAEKFIKIRVKADQASSVQRPFFSYVGRNSDTSVTFVGKRDQMQRLSVPYEEDRRGLTVEEVFIHFSDQART